jgi:hypothetical protein
MFKHYNPNGKKEKWEVYADVLRELYLEIGKFKASDATFRDSFEYTRNCGLFENENKKEVN